MKTITRMGRPTLTATIIGLAALGMLAGCATAAPAHPGQRNVASAAGVSAPTPTVPQTLAGATGSSKPAEASPDDAIDALSAWHACAVLGLANYASNNPDAILQPFDAAHPPTRNADGSYEAIAAFPLPRSVAGAGSIVFICTIGGTLGNPTLVSWTSKDV